MFSLIFDKEATKYLKKLDLSVRRRIRDSLVELAENPYSDPHVKRLKGFKDLFRKRVGDYRIVFGMDTENSVIMVLRVASRGQVYKK
jgi:mRNA interferase RelE/StbE